jgi:hypothetical protein
MRAMPLVSVFVSALFAAVPRASAADPSAFVNVRPLDETAAHFLRFGSMESGHFRALVEALEASNVIVYVEVRQDSSRPVGGGLRFLGEAYDVRWVRATVDSGTSSRARTFQDIVRLTAILGHELHHAVEASAAASLADVHEFEQYFRMLGPDERSGVLDTRGARDAGRRVASELRGMGRPARDAVRAARLAPGTGTPQATVAAR